MEFLYLEVYNERFTMKGWKVKDGRGGEANAKLFCEFREVARYGSKDEGQKLLDTSQKTRRL